VYQDLDSYFGNRLFTGKEQRLYGNLIFQDNIFDTRHTLKGGLDFNSFSISQDMWEKDGSYYGLCTGVYGEYSYVHSPDGEGFSMILGQRLDVLRYYLPFYVPRIHLKYNSGPWAFRGQASRSWRIATLGSEYLGYMANNRTAEFLGYSLGPIYPPIERSNTYGIGVNWTKDVLFKEMQWNADIFYTQFANKVVFDFDGSTDTILIGSPGGSYPNVQERILYSPYSISAQVGGQYELFHRTMIRVSYRYQDVKQRDLTAFYASGAIEDYFKLEEVILNVPHLVYVGASYSGRKGMGIEINATYNSSQRLPDVGYENRSPAFTMLNGQISKEGRTFGQIYVGIQNALNVRQLNPVVGGDLPFDGRFDASIVWGPIMGRQIYAGWRYDLKFQE
jgi:outer membrane receptor for ferrienterochelin and colicins